MEKFKEFLMKYRGAIIGGIVAFLILLTHFYELIIGSILIALGIYVGNYIQLNKESVKDKLKKFIDKM